jgi:hypothetical protein
VPEGADGASRGGATTRGDAPGADGPARDGVAARTRARRGSRGEGLRERAARRAGLTLGAILDHGSPRLVRHTVGSEPAMLLIFSALARSLRGAARSGELQGDLQFDLLGPRGSRRAWTVSAGPERAVARRGPSAEPTLVLRTTHDDLLRLVSGHLDAGDALLDGRLDLEGDLALAVRMGDLFRR